MLTLLIHINTYNNDEEIDMLEPDIVIATSRDRNRGGEKKKGRQEY